MPGDDSLPGEAAEGSNLAEVQPLRAVHKRSVRSRERVHTWPMSVGWGWLAAAMMCDQSVEPWRKREPLAVTARMCSSRVSHSGARQDCIGKDKADGWCLHRKRDKFDYVAIMDEAEEYDADLNRVKEGRVLCVFRWWFVVACLRGKWDIGF
jgi:hypothetical protein